MLIEKFIFSNLEIETINKFKCPCQVYFNRYKPVNILLYSDYSEKQVDI